MTLPPLPTDNLYKFIALSGIAIVILAFCVPFQMAVSVNSEVDKLNEEMSVLNAKNSFYSEQTESIKQMKKNSPEKKELQQRIQSFELEYKTTNARLNSVKNALQRKIKEVHQIMNIGVYSCLVGCLFAIIGFCFWYNKVQKKLDKELDIRLAELTKDSRR